MLFYKKITLTLAENQPSLQCGLKMKKMYSTQINEIGDVHIQKLGHVSQYFDNLWGKVNQNT